MKLRCTCRRGATGIAAGKLRRAMAPVSFAMWLAVFPRPAASDQGGSAAPANSPTVSSTQFQVRFSGAPGARYVVEGSGDLKEWIPVSTNTVSSAGYLDFVDVQVGEFPHRFYRTAPLSGRVSLQGLLESFRQDRILVKPKPGILLSDLEALATLLGAQILQSYPEIGDLEVLHVPPTSSVTDLIAIYQASGLVEYAEPDFQVSALAVPNDFRYNDGNHSAPPTPTPGNPARRIPPGRWPGKWRSDPLRWTSEAHGAPPDHRSQDSSAIFARPAAWPAPPGRTKEFRALV